MKSITLRPVDSKRDFGELAALFSMEQGELASEPDLKADYMAHKDRIFHLRVAEDEQGRLLGFNWATRSRFDASQAYFYVIVKPEHHGQGAGSRLYADVEQAAKAAQVKQLQVSIRDTCPECRAFADRRGFTEQSHHVGLWLDMNRFDDRTYAGILSGLKEQGFQFTTMDVLGNTEEAQRRLYLLNDSTDMERIVPVDNHSWLNFEDFQKKVCREKWYLPGGQWIAIDGATGHWAAMSAITRYEGCDYAWNLHTGVDRLYHGRKLAQAMLVLALRYAREVLKVTKARTDENAGHLPAMAIYQALGYTQTAGTFSMEKNLEQQP